MKLRFEGILAAAALAVMATTSTAWAQQPQGPGEGEDPVAIYKEAGINADQEGQIRKLAREFESAQRVRSKTVYGYLREMSEIQLEPDPAEEKVLAKQKDINDITATMANERVKLMLKIRAILTPEQKQRLVKLIKERAEAAARARESARSMQ
ncbi:MAG: Spy/CpxP family protein refolding chaperone [Candidatus Melainabacteria bacterium]|nr:Spy/CpxP family protein refolding chaperone [Candidatus Melainabacteria bacterium]